jgi:hypothetical protein
MANKNIHNNAFLRSNFDFHFPQFLQIVLGCGMAGVPNPLIIWFYLNHWAFYSAVVSSKTFRIFSLHPPNPHSHIIVSKSVTDFAVMTFPPVNFHYGGNLPRHKYLRWNFLVNFHFQLSWPHLFHSGAAYGHSVSIEPFQVKCLGWTLSNFSHNQFVSKNIWER